jgi:hypothetical protein
MKNLALKPQTGLVFESGVVTAEAGGVYTVRTGYALLEALQAASCLLKPAPGDRVVLAVEESSAFVLAVLERPQNQEAQEIRMNGPVTFHVQNGDLDLRADHGLAVTGGTEMAVSSPNLELSAAKARVGIEDLSWKGRLINAQVERIRFVAHALDSVYHRIVQRIKSSYRYVEGHEEVQSASSRFLVDGTLTMRTQNTVHTAEEHIKMDARQIHLG